MTPLVKVGGLGDAIAGLTRVLAQRGHDIRVVVPLYGCIDQSGHNLEPTDITYGVSVKAIEEPVRIWRTSTEAGVQVYLVEHEAFFGTREVYTARDLNRFFYFSRASLELLRHLDWRADVLHCHDWHTACAISLLKNDLRQHPRYSPMGSLFTIHNLAYQGWFDYSWATAAGIVGHIPTKEDPLHSLMWRMMALGVYHADLVSTVSETYAREILTPEYGEGLDPVLRHRQGRLWGILNGIDYEEFNPATDPHLPANYRPASASRKRRLKEALQKEVGLPVSPRPPLVGYVGRLTRQKGILLLVDAMERLLTKRGVQFLVLGQIPRGEEGCQEVLEAIEASYPQQVRLAVRFDEGLARRIYAGCDLLVVPSLYEPCGLVQLIALRYGTIPVVRHTGGLADTVQEHPIMGNGFVFHDARDGADLAMALERAVTLFQSKEPWARLVARAMSSDVSWDRACQKYEDLYRLAVERHYER